MLGQDEIAQASGGHAANPLLESRIESTDHRRAQPTMQLGFKLATSVQKKQSSPHASQTPERLSEDCLATKASKRNCFQEGIRCYLHALPCIYGG